MLRRFTVLFSFVALCTAPMAITPTAAEASFNITASGTWVSNDGALSGTWEATFGVAGYDLSGTLNLIGMPDVAEGNVFGSWDADDIGFGLMFLDQELASFTGGLVGDRFDGEFTCGDIEGIWTGALSSLDFGFGDIDPIIGDLPTLVVDRIQGQVGQITEIGARLETLGAHIGAVEGLLNIDQTIAEIVRRADGTPDCELASILDNTQSVIEFLPLGCLDGECNEVRVILHALDNLDAIADGVELFKCKVQIIEEADAGIYQVIASALRAFDPSDFPLPIDALPGEIKVKEKVAGLFGDCQCRTIQEAGMLPLPSLLAPLALVLLRRRREQIEPRVDD